MIAICAARRARSSAGGKSGGSGSGVGFIGRKHSNVPCVAASTVLHHALSMSPSNLSMKVIGQIRRERLQQLLTEKGLSLAELNSRLGRLRRDATLSQILNAAPNSTTKRVRQMGDDQARFIESSLSLPEGWFDCDPDFERLRTDIYSVRESTPVYQLWPFRRVSLEAITRLSDYQRSKVEAMLENALQLVETEPHEAPASSSASR